jgi:hypothetical protein
MITDYQIPEPFLFNPLKHHLGFMKEFINLRTDGESNDEIKNLIKELKHIGTSVIDVYKGDLSEVNICSEVGEYLGKKKINQMTEFSEWAGIKPSDCKIISLSDNSQWTIKFQSTENRFVHIFPARSGPHSFRIKANTLKSAILYNILIGKYLVTVDDLNRVRPLLGLSPVKDTIDVEAILEMIEILRG